MTSDAAVLGELGRRLERVRRERGWSRAELAERSGVSERTLVRLEGGASLQMASWVAVVRALGLLDELDAVGEDAGPSPLAMLEGRQGRRRRRAAGEQAGGAAWRWGDES